MVWIGGPRRRIRGAEPLRLHDPPPGYKPERISEKDKQRNERQNRVLARVAAATLVPLAAATVVLIVLMIALHH